MPEVGGGGGPLGLAPSSSTGGGQGVVVNNGAVVPDNQHVLGSSLFADDSSFNTKTNHIKKTWAASSTDEVAQDSNLINSKAGRGVEHQEDSNLSQSTTEVEDADVVLGGRADENMDGLHSEYQPRTWKEWRSGRGRRSFPLTINPIFVPS